MEKNLTITNATIQTMQEDKNEISCEDVFMNQKTYVDIFGNELICIRFL